MSITSTQAQVFASHLAALRHSLNKGEPIDGAEVFDPGEVLASLTFELGPFVSPMLAESINQSNFKCDCIPADSLDTICESIDRCEDVLLASVESGIPPEKSFREIIAKLLEQLGPFMIQALIVFLMKEEPKPKVQYASLN